MSKKYLTVRLFSVLILTFIMLIDVALANADSDKRKHRAKPKKYKKPLVHTVQRKRFLVFDHQVSRNERVDEIARKYAVKLSDLVIINKLSSPYDLRPGQKLSIPYHGQKIPKYAKEKKSLDWKQERQNSDITIKKVPKYKKTTTLENEAPLVDEGEVVPEQVANNKVKQHVSSSGPQGTFRRIGNLSWVWPTSGQVIRGFSPENKAISINGKLGQNVYASASGEVVFTGNNLVSFGNLVIIKHSAELLTTYAHNRRLLVKEGEKVKGGQAIAEMGQDRSHKALLRFEVRLRGSAVDPSTVLPNPSQNR